MCLKLPGVGEDDHDDNWHPLRRSVNCVNAWIIGRLGRFDISELINMIDIRLGRMRQLRADQREYEGKGEPSEERVKVEHGAD